jgi:molecular chaperone HscA
MALISINLQSGKVNENEKDWVVGIDLGTTNSLVAYMKEGSPVCVADAAGKNTLIPSVLHFGEKGEILVGDAAKEKLITDPKNTLYSVKRLMGKSYPDVAKFQQYFGYTVLDSPNEESLVKVRVGDKYYTPIELSSFILRELKTRIESVLGQNISKAVITVPAYFNDSQRQATRDAGKLAGLEVLRIVNEPTAAALAYGLNHNQSTQTLAVFDLGGGTFDVSILQIQDGIFEVLATHGDTFLGGDDFDRLLTDHWLGKHNIAPEYLVENKEFGQEMRLAAEKAKKELSRNTHFETQVQGQVFKITRPEFEALILPLVEKTLKCCADALRDSKLQVTDIQAVVMVGGSTRVPLVKEKVADFFKQKIFDELNPDEVVALGAAIQADILAGNQRDILLIDVTPLSLGIETVGGLMDVIVPRNSKIPSKTGRQYTTSVDGQTQLKVAVFQGERDVVAHNRKLGEFILKGIPPMPAGLPKIDIAFYLDADGILKVRAQELRSGVAQTVVMKASYGLSEEEMALMLIDSIQNAAADLKIRALVEARNEGQNIVLAAEKFLIQNNTILSEEEKNTTQALTNTLRSSLSGEEKDAINAAMEALNVFTEPLAHRALDHNIGEAIKGKSLGT